MIEDDFPSAKVICHSQAPNGEELITLELEFHRFILSELNTHRSFSRNAQSSRAVPIEKMIEQVRTNPAMPVHWGKNQRGMVAEQEHNEKVLTGEGNGFLYSREDGWRYAALEVADIAEDYAAAGYHKQIVNRLLEPFMRTKGVVTATKDAYEAFFKLRCHKDAQPEIKLLAERMQKAIAESKPRNLYYGEYHLPYFNLTNLKEIGVRGAVKISSSCSAQVSYRRLDDSLDKAYKVYDMLNLPVDGDYPEDPPHFSPTEHIAKVVADYKHESYMCGNFHSGVFWQYRKALEMGMESEFLGEQND
ncbi:thymidylate synthase [Rheinheimera phage Barba5S]|uniref:Thymidylate synthase n=2 Tax=Barbavirus TaxID=2733095 RepID=A0A4P8N9J6_9CAUD|nr:thymidylate synthase [Rheinheimera phage Barba5S]YP_009822742.1 thymidylate synthase [Rheinheimera phage Barba8S]QCQ59084.1 thymidylate synthase [Rheinheimera phage Barba5S]QCQ59637.1 thymidylate synthase [Rheinheimera phage Barba8S]